MNKNLQNGFILGAALQGKTEAANPFPITVTFMNGETEWAKVGVDGEGKIAEPTEPPIPDGYSFLDGWYDGENKITFPYVPTENKTISVKFKSVAHPELEYRGAGTTLWGNVTKANNGTVILGYWGEFGRLSILSIEPLTRENIQVVNGGSSYGVTQYKLSDGKTYFYNMYYTDTTQPEHFVPIDELTPTQKDAQKMLDYYLYGI